MLVLSRRPGEKIVIPSINATIEVVSSKSAVVKLGIDAPSEVRVLRAEVMPPGEAASLQVPRKSPLRELCHAIRNRLNSFTIGTALLRRQIQAGMLSGVAETLDRIDRETQGLREQMDAASPSRAAPPRKSKPAKALLVEDDRNERELLAGFLRMAGFQVATAGDGADALDYLREQGLPDFMLLDMVLPRCDGPSTVRAIRQDPAYSRLKIFAVSGHPREEFSLGTGPSGVDRWFSKPVNPEALLGELNRELTSSGS